MWGDLMKPITRKEKLIAGEELTPITREEMFLKKYGGGASSWNDLTDKPFGEETTTVNEPLNITWDGNTEGLVSGTMGDGQPFPMFKVSDLVLTDEQLKMATTTNSAGTIIVIKDQWESGIEDGGVVVGEDLTLAVQVLEARVDGATLDYGGMTLVFPEKGLYFMVFPDGTYVKSFTTTEPIEHEKTVIKKVDEKYLPDSVDGVVIRSSTADSTKKFKLTVDDSGTIRAVEIGGK